VRVVLYYQLFLTADWVTRVSSFLAPRPETIHLGLSSFDPETFSSCQAKADSSTMVSYQLLEVNADLVGVPRIMEGTLPDTFAARGTDDAVTAAAKRWIQTARLNINARQVFPPGFTRPS
jgi:hypothetical protein